MSEETNLGHCDENVQQLRRNGRRHRLLFFIGTWTLIAVLFLGITVLDRNKTHDTLIQQQQAVKRHYRCLTIANKWMDSSEVLSGQLWRFASTGELSYGFSFLDRMKEGHLNSDGLDVFCLDDLPKDERYYLMDAKKISETLLEREKWALRLLFEAKGLDELPLELASVTLSESEQELSKREKMALARNYIFGEIYSRRKGELKQCIRNFQEMQLNMIRVEQIQEDANMERYMDRNLMMGFLIVSWLLMLQIGIYFLLIRPVSEYSQRLLKQSKSGCEYAPLDLQGSFEMKNLGLAFNHVLSQLQEAKELLQVQNEELMVLSKTDHLTKVLNRLAMENYMEQLLEEYRGTDWPIGLIMLDLDHFKRFNDSYGHPAGDDALRHVAEILSELVDQKGGLISRMGGEEFFILLPGQGEEQLDEFAENLLTAVRETEIIVGAGTKKGLTVSMGSYVYHGGNESLKTLYTNADKALYAAKKQGRNRHVTYASLQEN